MYRFVDSQIASTDSLHSYTTQTLNMVPPSPASGRVRHFADDEPVGDTPRDAHLPGPLREPAATDLLEETLGNYVGSFFPQLANFLGRPPHVYVSAAEDMIWTCPQCGYMFCPFNMGIGEHASLVNIAPHLEVIGEDGTISIDTADYPQFLRHLDHFIYMHVDHAHLRDIGAYLTYPELEAEFPVRNVHYCYWLRIASFSYKFA